MTEGVSSLMSFVRSNAVTIAGVAGCAFIGYAIYFDSKRRSDPAYKQKIRENRRLKATKGSNSVRPSGKVPDVNNATEMQAFFLQEVQLGEELIAENQVDEGVEHLCNAIMMCGQPQQLLQIFQQTLPPDHFSLIVQKLPETRERLGKMFGVVPGDMGMDADSESSVLPPSGGAHIIEEIEDRPPMVYMRGDGTPPPGIQALIDNDDLE